MTVDEFDDVGAPLLGSRGLIKKEGVVASARSRASS